MKRFFQSHSYSDGDYAYVPTARHGMVKPGIKERLMNWFLHAEPEAEVYAQYGAYASPASMRADEPCAYAGASSQQLPGLQDARHAGVQQALREWKAAAAYFESVSDPELVDYAVYEMEAAQKRYIYLLHSAKSAAARRMPR